MMATDLDRKQGDIGKVVGNSLYLHVSAAQMATNKLEKLYTTALRITQLEENHFSVIRWDTESSSISFLDYPSFFEEAFPTLSRSWKVDANGTVSFRTYRDSLNPPILHRKELLLPPEHKMIAVFSDLTKQAIQLGLFDDPVRIGFKLQWEQLVRSCGYKVVGHTFTPIGNDESNGEDETIFGNQTPSIERYRTALSRQFFSAPIQALFRFNLIDQQTSFFDYGCGRGDDVRGLQENGIQANGWDPHFAKDNSIFSAKVVNLGFVLNVIEDQSERRDALKRAYELTEDILSVSVMIANEDNLPGTPFADGLLTKRRTFQKYYSQEEIRNYVADVTGANPISIAPGILFVFKNEEKEQIFLSERYRSRVRHLPKLAFTATLPAVRERAIRPRRAEQPSLFERHRPLLELLWKRCLELGREAYADEIPQYSQIQEAIGSFNRALRLALSNGDQEAWNRRRKQRHDDVAVHFALQEFSLRKPYKQLEVHIQRDIKAFFGDYSRLRQASLSLLQSSGNVENIESLCKQAAELGLGLYQPNQSLELLAANLERLPALLRVYVGCAGVLYGDTAQADLIKIHTKSGKVTFSHFENFYSSPIPIMVRRVKVNLRRQSMDVFDYKSNENKSYLFLKSRYMNEESPLYAEQVAFDEAIVSTKLFDFSNFGPPAKTFDMLLQLNRWEVSGFKLIRSTVAPNLDDLCGATFTYRALIECGETQKSTKKSNLPMQSQTWAALLELAINLLDPIVDFYGSIKLTFGFCSTDLAKSIPAKISPPHDQHASHEVKRGGKLICPRGGAAVDFLVEHEDMFEVAQWIAENLPFDRIYVYGRDRPIHMSYGPDNSREIVAMITKSNAVAVPKRIKVSDLFDLDRIKIV